jgi:hypothetical protein
MNFFPTCTYITTIWWSMVTTSTVGSKWTSFFITSFLISTCFKRHHLISRTICSNWPRLRIYLIFKTYLLICLNSCSKVCSMDIDFACINCKGKTMTLVMNTSMRAKKSLLAYSMPHHEILLVFSFSTWILLGDMVEYSTMSCNITLCDGIFSNNLRIFCHVTSMVYHNHLSIALWQ